MGSASEALARSVAKAPIPNNSFEIPGFLLIMVDCSVDSAPWEKVSQRRFEFTVLSRLIAIFSRVPRFLSHGILRCGQSTSPESAWTAGSELCPYRLRTLQARLGMPQPLA